jgi:hypothetical protein
MGPSFLSHGTGSRFTESVKDLRSEDLNFLNNLDKDPKFHVYTKAREG